MSSIGLDVGTSRVKAVRFDADLRELDSESEATRVQSGRDGRREQDLREVWGAARRVLSAVARRAGDTVDLVAVTAQGDGTWLVDDQGDPCGPALLWNDSRAAGVVDGWHRDGTLARAFAISGSMGAPGLASAQLTWLREHEPERLARAATLLSCGSWVHRRLTGARVLERSEAANPFCSADNWGYSDELLSLFRLGEERRLLPEVVAGESAVAPLTAAAAREVGLPEGTPVVLAPYDVLTAATGTGAVVPGAAVAILGTTLCVGVASDGPRLDREPAGMTLPSGPPEGDLVAYATLTGTEALDWAARLLGLDDAVAVVRLAARAEGDVPLFAPYLSSGGERAPFLDPAARAGLHDLGHDHGPAEVARAVLDGLTLAVADCVEAAGGAERLAVCGGGSRSELWCRLIADATGATVVRGDVEEVGALGAVLHGQVALGHDDDLVAARSGLGSRERSYDPDPAARDSWSRRLAELRRVRGGAG